MSSLRRCRMVADPEGEARRARRPAQRAGPVLARGAAPVSRRVRQGVHAPPRPAAARGPETAIFGRIDEQHVPMHNLSSAAAHLTGRQLASSESFTWLGEHLQVSLADVKPAADFLSLPGVNHSFFHGTPYSPDDVP